MGIRFQVESMATDVVRIRHLFVNLYLVGTSERWVLIDGGLPRVAPSLVQAAESLFGSGNPPAAILLTHGHFDHVGAFPDLFKTWDVPVYAHALELPHLTGASDYPKPHPLIPDGAMAWLSFLYPRSPIDLDGRVQALPADGTVPELPDWRWVHTPGHTAGHVSLYRERDGVLIAGDAFTTVKQESLVNVALQRQEVHGPPAYFTPNWSAAASSIAALALLKPSLAGTGHGTPMSGAALQRGLDRLVKAAAQRALR
jgi:glyoxylase-like metal-dependent hydrolase (beta-lactamase superfamily II)